VSSSARAAILTSPLIWFVSASRRPKRRVTAVVLAILLTAVLFGGLTWSYAVTDRAFQQDFSPVEIVSAQLNPGRAAGSCTSGCCPGR